MKKLTMCLLLAGVVSIGSIFIQASPASAWTVRVHNPTDEWVFVSIYVNKLITNEPVTTQNLIRPGDTGTFETGGLCPSGISGMVSYRGGALSMQSHSCLGKDVDYQWFTACCWNVNFKVVRKKGDENSMSADDYGFSLE